MQASKVSFFDAAKSGDTTTLQSLLATDPSLLNYTGAGTADAVIGNTALHWAAAKGHSDALASASLVSTVSHSTRAPRRGGGAAPPPFSPRAPGLLAFARGRRLALVRRLVDLPSIPSKHAERGRT